MSRNAAIIDDVSGIFRILESCSLSKSANIPMIVVRTFIPSETNEDVSQQPPPITTKFGLKLFTKQKQFKQIEIHRGMTINALFSRDNWLFIKTAQNDSGYVPLDTCRPVVKRQNVNNKTQIIDTTNVSLLDLSAQKINNNNNYHNNDDEEMLLGAEDENLSELEFSQYDNKNITEYLKLKHVQQNCQIETISEESQQRLFKIRHYFKSLEVETNIPESSSSSGSSPQQTQRRGSIAIDSGYSDCEYSNVISTKQTLSQDILSKPARRGIKTNGSICSISPNQAISKSSSMNSLNTEPIVPIVPELIAPKVVEIAVKGTKTNLSTIIEQSYNSTMELQRTASMSLLGNNSLIQINKCELSNLQPINSSKSSSCAEIESTCYKRICADYEPLFVEDLVVYEGEYVTILEDHNPEWCYVISKNGKGYIPRNCIQF